MEMVELTRMIENLVVRAKDGIIIETEKIDTKRQWYNLSEPNKDELIKNVSEFLKDVVGIANSRGKEGFLIIGIDAKNGDVFNAPFMDSGINDHSNLRNLIVKHVDPPFSLECYEVKFEAKNLSVLVIDNSINKPHVIKNYVTKRGHDDRNYIPIRKNTSTVPADRHDIEMMFIERGNYKTERGIDIISFINFGGVSWYQNLMDVTGQIAFENYGNKATAITHCALKIYSDSAIGIVEDISFSLLNYGETIYNDKRYSLNQKFLIIQPNQIETVWATFQARVPVEYLEIIRQKDLHFSFEATDSHCCVYVSEILTKN